MGAACGGWELSSCSALGSGTRAAAGRSPSSPGLLLAVAGFVSIHSVQIISCVWTLNNTVCVHAAEQNISSCSLWDRRSPNLFPRWLTMTGFSLTWVDYLGCLQASDVLLCGFCSSRSFQLVAQILPRSILSVSSMKERCPDRGLFMHVDLAWEQVLAIKKLIWADEKR